MVAEQAVQKSGTAHVPLVRNANYKDMLTILNEQQARTKDMIVPSDKMKFVDGMLMLEGLIADDDGVIDPNIRYWPTQVFDDQLAARLGIDGGYLRRLRHGREATSRDKTVAVPRLDLFDANVNGLLRGRKALVSRPAFNAAEAGAGFEAGRVLREGVPADPRSFFLRLFLPDNGVGIARAMLSNKFARMDNVDGLMAMLAGIQDAGIDPDTLRIYGDLSETRMFIHVQAPQILAEAPALLDGYRSPFDSEAENNKRRGKQLSLAERVELGRQFRERGHGDGNHQGFYEPGNEPLVHAGFVLSNSEVGSGRWQIRPEVTVLRCSNGLTMTKEGYGHTHVGSAQDEGQIKWSADTQSKELELVIAKTRDTVKAVLSSDWLEAKVEELEGRSGAVIEEPEKTIEVVAKKFKFSKAEQEGILRHFLLSGQITSGGVMQAVTSYSQTVPDLDAAYDLNARAIESMELAYAMS